MVVTTLAVSSFAVLIFIFILVSMRAVFPNRHKPIVYDGLLCSVFAMMTSLTVAVAIAFSGMLR